MRKNWMSLCKIELEKTNKKIVLIGGASSAGKTYKCNMLKQYLESFGKKVLVVSFDNFYNPISKRITRKSCKECGLENYNNVIFKIIKQNTENFAYDDKFCNKNVAKIYSSLKKILPVKLASKLINQIIYNYKNINFDEPDAIDFENITNQIEAKDYIKIPQYSFKTSEVIGFKTYNKNDYDYILFEGIFALNDKILNNVDKNKVITISLKSDMLTMLSRRLYRDLIKDRRTRSPKDTFESYFEQVMPCYFEHILPTLKNANIKINSILTEEEINEKKSNKILNYNIEILDNKCKNIKLYIEINNDVPLKLIFKYQLKNSYKFEEYDLQNFLGQNNLDKILKYFKSINLRIQNKKEKDL